MKLRPRQRLFVENCRKALASRLNTLGVAPTGSGKTLVFSALIGEEFADGIKRALVLQHRDEITEQSIQKFHLLYPNITSSIFDASEKSWSGQTTFAMVQTLSRKRNLDTMPPLDLIVIDEVHHVRAETWTRIIDHARMLNDRTKIFGVTATPTRGDRKSLRQFFDNLGDQITLGEMVAAGHLVRPRTFVIDVGTRDALKAVKRTAGDYDMDEVEKIMNKQPVNAAIVKHWKEQAGERKTIVFCSTIVHSQGVEAEFKKNGIEVCHVDGNTPKEERARILKEFERGKCQVLTNVNIVSEGYDCPPASCVVLLRPHSFKSTMIQMIGRALRTIDPEIHPGITKTDCIVLDFGISSLIHGTLEQDVHLEPDRAPGPRPTKDCPSCGAFVPLGTTECPFCGYVWEGQTLPGKKGYDPLIDFSMTEIDLLARSDWKWVDPFGDGTTLMAAGFHAWAGLFLLNGQWYALGRIGKNRIKIVATGDKNICLANADDFLNEHETDETAHKSRYWLNEPASDMQLHHLGREPADLSMTKYHASCLLNFRFNKHLIQNAVFNAAKKAKWKPNDISIA